MFNQRNNVLNEESEDKIIRGLQSLYLNSSMIQSPNINRSLTEANGTPMCAVSPTVCHASPYHRLNSMMDGVRTGGGNSVNLLQQFNENQNANYTEATPPGPLVVKSSSSDCREDEISKSLQMFAEAANSGETIHFPQTQVDVMQDFECNGQITDDPNRYQQMNTSQTQHIACCNYQICSFSSDISQFYQHLYQKLYQQQLRSPLRTIPVQFYGSNVTTENLGGNGAYNKNNNSSNRYYRQKFATNKLQKRQYSKREKPTLSKHCVFCENNNEPEAVVKSHALRDIFGNVLCPKLRTYICPICKASGDNAHTIKYCPNKPIVTMEDTIRAEAFRLSKMNILQP